MAQTQQLQQSTSQQQAAPPNTSAYTSSGTMSAIDPALLQAQWLQYQQGQLSQSAIIPQANSYYAPQYAPSAPQGEVVSAETMSAITDFVNKAGAASVHASEYIQFLEYQNAILSNGYQELIEFSNVQDELICKFLFDREFTLDYARGAWIREGITDGFMSRLADVYLEIDALSPRGNREFSGNPNTTFDAVVPTPQYQNVIPPLPSSSGNDTPYMTMDQYLAAQQQGQVAQARAAAMINPAGLYAAFLSQASL
jgi:hypothetical protein